MVDPLRRRGCGSLGQWRWRSDQVGKVEILWLPRPRVEELCRVSVQSLGFKQSLIPHRSPLRTSVGRRRPNRVRLAESPPRPSTPSPESRWPTRPVRALLRHPCRSSSTALTLLYREWRVHVMQEDGAGGSVVLQGATGRVVGINEASTDVRRLACAIRSILSKPP